MNEETIRATPTKMNVLGAKLKTPEKNVNTPTTASKVPAFPANFEVLFACAIKNKVAENG
jgi:hypothetical protein